MYSSRSSEKDTQKAKTNEQLKINNPKMQQVKNKYRNKQKYLSGIENLTFKPKINKYSCTLTSKEDRDSKPLWERLIEHSNQVKMDIDQKFIQKKIHEYQVETEGCTFTPRLYTKKMIQSTSVPKGNIYERCSLWKRNINVKVTEQRTKLKSAKRKECTFKPSTNAKHKTVKKIN